MKKINVSVLLFKYYISLMILHIEYVFGYFIFLNNIISHLLFNGCEEFDKLKIGYNVIFFKIL